MARRPRRASSRKASRFRPAFEVAEGRESPTSLWGRAAPLGTAAVHVANAGTAQPGAGGGNVVSTVTPSRNAVTFQPSPPQHTTGTAHSAPPQPPTHGTTTLGPHCPPSRNVCRNGCVIV